MYQVSQHGGVQLGPRIQPGLWIILQGGCAQDVHAIQVPGGGRRCVRWRARATGPERIYGADAACAAGVVDGVGVEQHLHFILQAADRPGLLLLRHPGIHAATRHAFQRGRGQVAKDRPKSQPGAIGQRVQLYAVFSKVSLHGSAQGFALGAAQVQRFRVLHGHVVGLHVQMTRRDPGPTGISPGLGQAQVLCVNGGPRDEAVAALQAPAVGAQALGQRGQRIGGARHRRGGGEQTQQFVQTGQ